MIEYVIDSHLSFVRITRGNVKMVSIVTIVCREVDEVREERLIRRGRDKLRRDLERETNEERYTRFVDL